MNSNGPISNAERRLTLALKVSLLLLAFSAPISIAATQTAWALALLFWLIKAFYVRPRIAKDGFTLAILTFVGLTLVSAAFSYEPRVSLGKMMSVSLVTIVFLVAQGARERSVLRTAVVLLLAGCFVACIYAFALQAIGKNLKVVGLAAESPLRAAGVAEGDTIITAGGAAVNSPADLSSAIARSPDASVTLIISRRESLLRFDVPRAAISENSGLGIEDWSRGRDTRASGFYGHYTTFAEVLQLIGSLALGLLISAPGSNFSRWRSLLIFVLLAISVALFLTLTRASWAGFGISAISMMMLAARRRTVLICILAAIPLALIGLYVLQQKRNVSFIDLADASTTWRTTVWREGSEVLISKPRHLLVGVGMDALKTHWQEWHMFDDGRIPIGHLHSDPLQLAFERGVPTLIAWIVWMFLFLRMLYGGIRERRPEWVERGVFLGSFGGTIGFLSSGMVHYNWGDSEVVMVFYVLMGLSLAARSPGDVPAQGDVA